MGRCGFSVLGATGVKARRGKGLTRLGFATHGRTLFHGGFSDFGVVFWGQWCYTKVCPAQLHLEKYIFSGFQRPAVAIPNNPYEGLKQSRSPFLPHHQAVAIPNNPYEGLKRYKSTFPAPFQKVAIPNNPYEGLKRSRIDLSIDDYSKVAIPNNPYEGLKQLINDRLLNKVLSQFLIIPMRD